MARLQHLPNELQHMVFSHLDEHTLKSLAYFKRFKPVATTFLLRMDVADRALCGSRVLSCAVFHNNMNMMERYFAEVGRGSINDKVHIDKLNARGTLLHAAAAGGYRDMAAMLLDNGAFIDATACSTGFPFDADNCIWPPWYPGTFSPLCIALASGYDATAQLLLEKGASLESGILNMSGVRTGPRTRFHALHAAAFGGCHDSIKTLLGAGDLSIDRVDGKKRTPLHWACMSTLGAKHIQQLIELGADVNARADGNQTALHKVAAYIHNWGAAEAAMVTLIKAGADINAMDNQRMTPLSQMVMWLSDQRIRFMLDNGARPSFSSARDHPSLPLARLLLGYKHKMYREAASAQCAENCARMLIEADDARETDVEAAIGRKKLYKQFLRANLANVAELLRQRGAAVMDDEEERGLILEIANQPWESNASLLYLLEHGLPNELGEPKPFGLFQRLLPTRAVRYPEILKLMRPAFDAHQMTLEGVITLLVNLVGSPYYRHPSSDPLLNALLNRCTNVNWRDSEGRTLAHCLMCNSSESYSLCVDGFAMVLDRLIARGLDLNARDKNGHTVLHYLAMGRTGGLKPDIAAHRAHVLIEKGADARLRDNMRQRAFDIYTLRVPEWRDNVLILALG